MCSTSERRPVRQAFRFELDPNREQRVLLAKSVGASRYVYNWGLAESQRVYELTGKRPRLGDLKKQLVELKQCECPWLYEVSAHIGQQALVDLDLAFDRFFKSLKVEGPKSGFPRFKRKGERDSCRLYGVELSERKIRLPMIGRVRLKERVSERGFEGRILSATIRRRADRWFVSLAVERDREVVVARPIARPSDVVGVDLGLKAAAVIYDGAESRVVKPQQPLRKNLASYRISCQRQDFLHHLSSQLAKTKSLIVLEDLHVRGMRRNKHLALSISDAGMGELRRQLGYKSEWYGSTLVIAARFFPSSRLCSGCGVLNEQLQRLDGLKARSFDCSSCSLSLDRDENAAINLRRYGLNALSGELGIVPLPEGLREVTPVGEEGAGFSSIGVKPASLKQEAKARRAAGETRRSTAKGVLVWI